ncbi:ABC transporter substrate-binding protein [Idiomarina abyssalis]|uniref:ABC transporter substrate-binding protein n=1 Tax=Idiomarina abyssalis TaxID=86102 RepID=UPI0006C8AE7A|nr:ABC transporter substrate-binding protein [Idiomarina abyssalis]KPD22751.1 peptide ABC transporter substrate-binding protein [Idiomarina abyssalis]SFT46988.1 cationic peptide transport system substrate-binding protein [Idiomarina abyssalis]
MIKAYANVAVIAAALVSGCQSEEPEPAPLADGIIYCSEGNPDTFNPQLITSGTTVDATAAQLYDRLIDYDAKQQKFVPALAKRWETLDNGTRYRFYLREGVQFHKTDYFEPTRELTAEDVQFSFNRWLDETSLYHHVGGSYPFFSATGLDQLINKVVKIDEMTVDIVLNNADSSFLANLATDFAIVLSAEYAQKLLVAERPEQIDSLPIGTGPYRFESYRKDILIRYSRHPDYWREGPGIKHLVYSITPNANKRMLKLVTGECDIIPYPLVSELKALNREQLMVTNEVSPNVSFWAFNTQKEPFDDPLVRQALSHAINREAIIQTIYYGNAELAQSILPPTSWAYDDRGIQYQYDPEKARRLLQEADHSSLDITIWAMPVQRVYNPNARRMAELMQSDLAQIGVSARIVSYEWNTFRRRLSRGEHDTVLIGWYADNADPDNFFRPLLSCAAVATGGNRANWCHTGFDQLLYSAIATTNPEERKALYRSAQHLLNQQQPLLPIAHSKRFQAQQKSISGVELPPYGGINFRLATKKPVQEQSQ